MINKLFEKMAIVAYPVLHGDKQLKIWKNIESHRDGINLLYKVNEKSTGLEIWNDKLLADNMTVEKAIEFIHADMDIDQPVGSEIIYTRQGLGVEIRELREVRVDKVQTKTEKIIEMAASKAGIDVSGFLEELKAKNVVHQKTSGTIKKKRKINIDDLDLDD